MNWRAISGSTSSLMQSSWAFPGATGERLWKLQSSCNHTNQYLTETFTKMTGKKVKGLSFPSPSGPNYDLLLPYQDGIFSKYPQFERKLRTSKFFSYRFGAEEHFINFIYDDTIKTWVPLQGWEGVISLVDWMKVFDSGGVWMQTYLKNKIIGKFDPIAEPKSYWNALWAGFRARFLDTQLLGSSDAELKRQLDIQFAEAQKLQNAPNRYILWVNCDTA